MCLGAQKIIRKESVIMLFRKGFIKTVAILASISMLSTFSVSADHYANNSEKYIAYDCITGEETVIDTLDYVCDVDSVEATSPSTFAIIGSDERTVVKNTAVTPYRGIGYLSVQEASGKKVRGSCAAFSKNAVLTAAHVVWDADANQLGKHFEITFAKNGSSAPYGTVTKQPRKIIYPSSYATHPTTPDDYAILLYDTDISGYAFGFSKTIATGNPVTVTGYPKDAASAGGTSNESRMWTHTGKVTSTSASTINYNVDTTGGQSGAPVYDSTNKIVATHHGGSSSSNSARRLDAELFNIMHQIRNGTFAG